MIEIKPLNSPGYPSTNLAYYGTVTHYRNGGFAVGVNWDYPSTLPIRRYLGGIEPPNYPVPAIPYQVDYCECDLGYIYIDNPNDSSRYVAVFIR